MDTPRNPLVIALAAALGGVSAGCTYPRVVELTRSDAAAPSDRGPTIDRTDATAPLDRADVSEVSAPLDVADVFDATDVRDAADVLDAARDADAAVVVVDASADRAEVGCIPDSASLMTDPRNCGACGRACGPPNTQCDQGACNEGEFPAGRPSDAGVYALDSGPHTFTRFTVLPGETVRIGEGDGTATLNITVLGTVEVSGTIDVGGGNGQPAVPGDAVCGVASWEGGGVGGWTGGSRRPLPADRGCNQVAGFTSTLLPRTWRPGEDGRLREFALADGGVRTPMTREGGRCAGTGGNYGGGGGGGRRGSGGGGGGGGVGGGGGGAVYWDADSFRVRVWEGVGGNGGAVPGGMFPSGDGGLINCVGDQSTCDISGGLGGADGFPDTSEFDGQPGEPALMVVRGPNVAAASGGGGGSIGFEAADEGNAATTRRPGSSGGGGGGGGDPCPMHATSIGVGGGGGGGGGVLWLTSLTSIAINSGARILADGGRGGAGALDFASGGGGGGSGGLIVLNAPELYVDARAEVHALGGQGGAGSSRNGARGGNGGLGRVVLGFNNMRAPCPVQADAFREHGFGNGNPCMVVSAVRARRLVFVRTYIP